jgi:hypothetical protein
MFVFYARIVKKQLFIFFLHVLTHNKFGERLKVSWVSQTYGIGILLLDVFMVGFPTNILNIY